MPPLPRQTPTHAPMTLFPVSEGELHVGGVSISRLAKRVGQTPFYVYDRLLIQQRIQELRSILGNCVKIHYAIKANPMPALVDYMAGLVDGLDVASGGELKIALDSGANPEEISFAGPGKSYQDLERAVAAGILINIESEREIDLLTQIQESTGYQTRVALRINPDFELKNSGMKMSGGPKQFGIDAERIPAILKTLAQTELSVEGFHIFSGAQNLKAEAIIEAQCKSYELTLKLAEYLPRPLRFLNLGGGFGIPYFPGEQRLDLLPIAENLAALNERAKKDFPEAHLVIELGRYLVGEAGLYVTRIVDKKVSRDQIFLITDGGLHHHLSASGNFGQVIRKNYPVAIATKMNSTDLETVSIVGPLCTPLDILADKMPLSKADIGDLVVIYQSGAYGFTASPQAFLGHPSCVEVLI